MNCQALLWQWLTFCKVNLLKFIIHAYRKVQQILSIQLDTLLSKSTNQNNHHPVHEIHYKLLRSLLLQTQPIQRWWLFSLSVMSNPATPWTTAHQASLSFTISRSLLRPVSTESVMPSNHLILCPPLLLLPSVFPSIGVFSNELALRFRSPSTGAFFFWTF